MPAADPSPSPNEIRACDERRVERFAALAERLEPYDGAGPAGVRGGAVLAACGHGVTVYECRDRAGGNLADLARAGAALRLGTTAAVPTGIAGVAPSSRIARVSRHTPSTDTAPWSLSALLGRKGSTAPRRRRGCSASVGRSWPPTTAVPTRRSGSRRRLRPRVPPSACHRARRAGGRARRGGPELRTIGDALVPRPTAAAIEEAERVALTI